MTAKVEDLLSQPPFSLSPERKAALLLAAVEEELGHHYEHCEPFRRWCDKRHFDPRKGIESLAAVPCLPVGVFKRLPLRSVAEEDVVRVLTSSATSSQVPSRVYLDATTRNRQMRALAQILTHLLGGKRRHFVVLDAAEGEGGDSHRELSARAAGMRGYLMAAASKEYVLDGSEGTLELNVERLLDAVARLKQDGNPFCFLGYTYVLYQYVVLPLRRLHVRLDLPANVRILHFGGWKRLREQAVDKTILNAHTAEVFGVPTRCICDVYGFTEQLGVVYPDDADGWKRTPAYAEVFVRDPRTLELVPDGAPGLLEFVCPLPHSYPGVAVLLDDMGRIVTREPSSDAIVGTAFEVLGRAERAEPRGCGDTLPGLGADVAARS